MLQTIFGVFLVLHGIVFVLYAGHSFRWFEMTPGLKWPDDSWAFTKIFGVGGTRTLAGVAYVLIALGFAIGGVGLLVRQEWWQSIIVVVTAASTMLIIFLWDGKLQRLPDKGCMGLFINLVILAIILIIQWPAVI